MTLDPERVTAAASALAGGAFYGIVNFSVLVISGQPVGLKDLGRAALHTACAMTAGALVAYFLFPALASAIPWPSLKDAHGLGFVIGASTLVLAPSALKFIKSWGERKAQEGSL